MRLNKDCVKELLLLVESRTPYDVIVASGVINPLPNYRIDDVTNAIHALQTGHKVMWEIVEDRIEIYDLTWDGHMLVDEIRNKKTW